MYRLALIVFALFFFFSCEDKINREDMYTFKGQTAVDYINASADLSLFSKKLLSYF